MVACDWIYIVFVMPLTDGNVKGSENGSGDFKIAVKSRI